MARRNGPTEAAGVSPGTVLETLTSVPGGAFHSLPPIAQAAVVARIVPERLRTLDRRQTDVIVDQAQLVGVGARPLVDAVVTSEPTMPSLTPGRLRRLCEGAAVAVDPAAVENRARLGLRDRFVRVEPGVEPGMSWWRGSLPSMVSLQAWTAIDELAHEYVRADPSRTVDQARADAFMDLLLGNAKVSTTVEVVVPTFVGVQPEERAAPPAPAGKAPPESEAATRAAASTSAGDDAESEAGGSRISEGRSSGFEREAEPAAPADWLAALGLSHLVGPALAPEHAIASELFARQEFEPSGIGQESLPFALMLHEHERVRREWEGMSARLLEAHGVDIGRWRPPELGVRDPRAGWILSSALVSLLTDPDVVLRLPRADALSGVTVARDPSRYRPNAALAQRVRDRDRTCRFPGCGVAARRCDLDHVVAYPDGDTTEENLACLCRTHHGFKHHSGWALTMTSTGVCTWTSPTGRSYVTGAADVRLDAA